MHIEINANDFELTDPIADHVTERVEKELVHLADGLGLQLVSHTVDGELM